MTTDFKHQQYGRRPVMWVLLALGLGFVGLMILHPAPFGVWIILGCYLAVVGWSLIFNPVHGIEITDQALIIDPHRPGRSIPLADIAFLKIDTRSDNTDFKLHLRSGEVVSLTSARVPSTAKTEGIFKACGVTVERL